MFLIDIEIPEDELAEDDLPEDEDDVIDEELEKVDDEPTNLQQTDEKEGKHILQRYKL